MNLYLRFAEERDCDLLFSWANDCDVRKNSFNADCILYKDHKKWFYEKIRAENNFIFIYCLDETPIGQIRIDIKDKTGIIDYSIDKKFRGKGFGESMMRELIEKIKFSNMGLDKLIGQVRIDNIPSQVIFKKLKFNEIKRNNYFDYYIIL